MRLPPFVSTVLFLLSLAAAVAVRADNWLPHGPGGDGRTFRKVWFASASVGWAVGDDGMLYRTVNGGTAWSAQTSNSTAVLYGVWGSDASNVWAVGTGGTILKWNGSAWSAQTSNSTAVLYAVWGSDASNVWAVGDRGTILKWNGTAWSAQVSGTTSILLRAWGSDASNVWAVGDVGTIRKWNGTAWTAQASGTTARLLGVWGSDANNVWAVGDRGTILKWNGTAWSAQVSTNTATLGVVWGSDASNVWAVGDRGTILKWNGSAWSAQVSGTTSSLLGVWARDASNVWAVGTGGTIRKWNGSAWSGDESSTTTLRYSVWGVPSGGTVLSVGAAGLVLARQVPTPPTISTHPVDATAKSGGTATFTVTATGDALTYRWQVAPKNSTDFKDVVDGAGYSGSTATTLTVQGLSSLLDGARFRCVVSGAASPAASSNFAMLTVTPPGPPVIISPGTFAGVTGTAFSYTIGATILPTSFSIKETLPTGLSLNTTTGVLSGTPTQSGTFLLTLGATNAHGTGSATLALTIKAPPAIVTQPVAATANTGQSASFTVAATGIGLTYQWKTAGTTPTNVTNGGAFSGATTPTLTIKPVDGLNGKSYFVVVTGEVGSPINSASASLTVTNFPAISAVKVPTSAIYKAGDKLDFVFTFNTAVTVTGTPRLALTVGSSSVFANYVSGSATTALTFRYTVQDADADSDGIEIGALALNGGTIAGTGGNALLNFTAPSTSGVIILAPVPTVLAIRRQAPSAPTSTATSATFRVEFSADVTGVDASDFAVTSTGGIGGAISQFAQVTPRFYDVTVSGLSGAGTLRLDLKSGATGILAQTTPLGTAGFMAGEVYQIDTNSTFPVQENYDGKNNAHLTSGGWILGGTATVTGDRLRLTEAVNGQSGSAIYNKAFDATLGVNVQFDYFIGSGTHADGLTFFLLDGAVATPTPGGIGYAIGYTYDDTAAGVSKAYMGVAFDVFGNFANTATFPDGSGAGLHPNTIVMRGPGTATNSVKATGEYKYVTGSQTSFPAMEGTRRVNLTVRPDGTITLRISTDGGATFTTIYNNFNFAATSAYAGYTQPTTFKLGFAAGTGGQNNIHAIDNLTVTSPVDLAVAFTSVPAGTLRPGDRASYVVRVQNKGPNADTGALFSYNVPSGLTGVTWSYSGTSGATNAGAGVGNSIRAYLNLPVGGITEFNVSGTVSGVGSSLVHSASISPNATRGDVTPTDNTVSTTTTISAPLASTVVGWGYAVSATFGGGSGSGAERKIALGLPSDKTIVAVSGSHTNSLALTSDGLVYGAGSRRFGELPPKIVGLAEQMFLLSTGTGTAVNGVPIVSVASGPSMSLLLTNQGKVYAAGENSTGLLGDAKANSSSDFVLVGGALAGKTIKAIAVGFSHALALDSDGLVYSWGSNGMGERGGKVASGSAPAAVAVDSTSALFGQKVVAIAAGNYYSYAVTDSGKVAAWGRNYVGDLGIGNNSGSTGVPTFQTYPANTKIVAVAPGELWGMSLASDGTVYTFGQNFANTGLGAGLTTSISVLNPTSISATGALAGKKIVAIAASGANGFVADSDGSLYGWGSSKGFGSGNTADSYNKPVLISPTGVLSGRIVTALAAGPYGGVPQFIALTGRPSTSIVPLLVSLSGPVSATYGATSNRNLDFTVTFNNAVTVAGGTPSLPLTIGSAARSATYLSGSGTSTLTFRYVVQAGDNDTDGITLAATSLALNGATISNSAGNASLAFATPDLSKVLVDTIPPAVVSSVRLSPAEPDVTARSIAFRVTFSKAVTGVDISDFALSTTGTAAGTVGNVAQVTGLVYDVAVTGVPTTATGTLRLDVNASGTGITDGPNALSGGYTSGETYTLSPAVDGPVISSAVTASGTYGSAFSYTITASNAPVSFSAAGLPAGLSLNKTTGAITGTPARAGNYSVTLGATNSGGSTTAALALSVAKAPLTIKANDVTVAYGAAWSKFLVDVTGLVNNDTFRVFNQTLRITTTAAPGSPPGTYAIAPSDATPDNYTVTYVNGTLTITAKPLAITLGSLSQSYTGGALLPTAATVPSGVPVNMTFDGSTTVPKNAGTYAVVASSGDSGYSGTASGTFTITKAAQTITISPINSTIPLKDFTSPVQLTATSSSNLPVTLTLGVSSAATLNGSNQLVSIGSTGTITIKANQAGDSNYNAATEVTLTLDVVKTNQSITFTNPDAHTAGDAPFALNATATSNLAVTFTVVSGPATVTGSTLTLTGPGTVKVRASQAGNAGFNPAPDVEQTFVVLGQSQTIAFPAVGDKVYGSPPFALNATSDRSLSITYAVISGPATLSGSTLTLTGAGTVVVRASQAGTSNISAATDVDLSIKVNKATLQGSIAGTSRAYGADNPAFPISFTGFVGSDTTASLQNPPVATTKADRTSPVGSYNIEASGGSDANYDFANLDAAKLQVIPRDQTITFNAVPSPTYGDSISLGASADSGLPITYTVLSGPALVGGKTLTLSGLGRVTVAADQPGDQNTNPAKTVTQTFDVKAKALTVTGITATSKDYDGTTSATVSLAAAALSGVVGSDDVSLVTSGATAAFASAVAGTGKTVTVSGLALTGSAASHYTLTPPTATADIRAATQSVAGAPYGWGFNALSLIGNGVSLGTVTASDPQPTVVTGVLAGKTVTQIRGNRDATFALTSDGRVYSWGFNRGGLGTLDVPVYSVATTPVAVGDSGVLAGKTVTGLAVGGFHILVLTSEGRIYGWGSNGKGPLSSSATNPALTPVAVATSGLLAGKTVTAIGAGEVHSVALTSEGRVYTWGPSGFGTVSLGLLGNNSDRGSFDPVAVDVSGALSGKTVSAIAVGATHTLVLTSDGKVFSWGDNAKGQLGNASSAAYSSVPVAVSTTGVLAGKTVVAIAAGGWQSYALTSDGVVAAWGDGSLGSGDASQVRTNVPVAVKLSGALAGKTVTAVAAYGAHALVQTSDGAVFGWGENAIQQLSIAPSKLGFAHEPVAIDTTGLLAGKTIVGLGAGCVSVTSMVIAKTETPPVVVSVVAPAVGTYGTGRNLDFTVAFSKAVTVSGAPSLSLTIGSTSRAAAFVPGTDATSLLFRYTVQSGDADLDGIALASPVALNGGGIVGADGAAARTFTVPDLAKVLVDTTAPVVSGIVRRSPAAGSVTTASVVYRVTFAEAVTGVDAADFTAVGTGTASGRVTSVSALNASVYDVTVGSIPLTAAGTLRLDLNALGTGIADLAGNAIGGGFTTGEVYTLVALPDAPVITSAGNAGATYGNSFSYTLTASNSPTSYTATQLPPGLSFDATTGVLSGAPTQAGVFAVTLSATNAGGTAKGTLTLTVAKATLTVRAVDARRGYGRMNSGFSMAFSGFVNGDTTVAVNPTITTIATQFSDVGTYALSPGGGVSDNYEFNYVPGTLTIRPVPVTITFSQLKLPWTGQRQTPVVTTVPANVPLTFAYVDNGAGQAISGPPSDAGSYTVAAVAGGNYTGEGSADFTITQALQTITLAPISSTIPLKDFTSPVQLTATSSADLPVTLSLDAGSAATLNSSNQLVSIGSTGIVTIRATQAGNANVAAATPVVVTLDVVKSNQSITFPDLPTSFSYGDAPIALTATASSSLPVVYSVVSGPATISGSTLTVTGAGKITVRAAQTGNATFNAAMPVNRILDVMKRAQSITFPAINDVTYGVAPITVAATSDRALPVSYSVSGPATLNGTTLTITGAGRVSVTATQAGDENTEAAFDALVSFNVAKKALTATALNASRAYGTGNPVFAIVYSGFAGSDTATNLATPPTASTTAKADSAPNTYPITLTDRGDANYTLTLVDATLTIGKRSQTITFAAPPDRAYGASAFALGAAASSALAPTYTLISGPATLAGDTLTLNGAGTVTVRASQAGDSSFDAAADITQSFTVTPKKISVTGVAVATKTYDGSSTATLNLGGASLVGVINADAVALGGASAKANFLSATAGTGKAVVVTGLDLTGAKAASYTLMQPTDITGTINAATAPVTLGNLSQTYTGSPLSIDASTTPAALDHAITYNGSPTVPTNAGTYTVVATIGSGGNYTGSATGTLTIAKAAQTVSFGPIAGTIPLKDFTGPVQIIATASSGLPVTITLDSGSAATLNSSNQLVSIGATGTVTLRANQAGDANYLAATEAVFTLDVTKTNQQISFASLVDKAVGDPAFDLSATATSGLGVTFSVVSGPATLAGNTLTLTGAAGVVTIRATQAGNAAYNPAPDALRSFTVVPGGQIITFETPSDRTYGNAAFDLSASASSGLPVTFTVLDGPATLSGNTLTITGAGMVKLRASQAGNANFVAAANIDRSFTVAKALLTVTAQDATRAYGVVNPAFSLNYAGFVGSDTVASLVAAPTAGTVAGLATIPGTVAITASGGSDRNYAFSYLAGALTITKLTQTLAFTLPATLTYGDSLNLDASATSGLGVQFEIISGPAVVSMGSLIPTGVGSVTIRAAQPGDAIYSAASAVDRSLTIAPRTLTVAGLFANNKNYDGTATGSLAFGGATLVGVVRGDTVALDSSGVTATFSARTPGVGRDVTIAGLGLSGSSAANYTLAIPTATADITAKPLTVTGVTAANKPYDGTSVATLSYATAVLEGVASGDTVTLDTSAASAAFADKLIGTGKPVTVTGLALTGASAVNYTIVQPTDLVADISKKALTATGIIAANRTYDATTIATLSTTGAALTGVVAGDTVTLLTTGVTGNFADKKIGTAKPVTLTGLSVTGTDASNYDFTAPTLTATVTAKTLTVTGVLAANKIFDGTTTATLSTTGAALVGVISGDTVSLVTTGATGTFDSSAAGANKLVTITGLALTGDDASNYLLTQPTATAIINQSTATVSLSGLSYTYDGTAKSAIVTVVPSVAVSVSYSGGNNPVGAGSYTVTALVTDPNYSGSATSTLTIAKATQTVAITAPSSVTAGTPVLVSAKASSGLPVTFTVSGPATLAGNSLTATGSGAVTLTATQPGNENYLPASATVTLGAIAKLAQTITFGAMEDKRTSDNPFALIATASSGLPVSFTILSGPALLSGNTVTLGGTAGTVTVRASQPGNAVYAAAPDVTRTFEVVVVGPKIYFGKVGGNDMAAQINPDGKGGTMIGIIPGTNEGFVVNFTLDASGNWIATVRTFTGDTTTTASSEPGRRLSAFALSGGVPPGPVATATFTRTFRGTVSGSTLSGVIDELGLTFNATLVPPTGPTKPIAGYYQSSSLQTATGSIYSIVGTNNQVYVLAITPDYVGGNRGTANADGTFSVAAASQTTITGSVDAPTTIVEGSLSRPGRPAESFAGIAVTTVRTDRLINLSTRARVDGTARTLVTGFVIGGSEPKTVLLRAVGPSLSDFGVAGALPAARLRLFDAQSRLLREVNGWSDDATLAATFARIGAFPLNASNADSALIATLAPGAYSMHVVPNPDSPSAAGVGMAEIYDAAQNPQSEYQRLVNISSLGTIESGAGVLIGGFVISGNAPKRVLIRAAGPALAPFGVNTPVSDPQLAIYDRDVVLSRNDNWGTPVTVNNAQIAATPAEVTAAETAVGAFHYVAGSRDAAVIVTLAPGAYTAHASGVNGGTGSALIEVYEIPNN